MQKVLIKYICSAPLLLTHPLTPECWAVVDRFSSYAHLPCGLDASVRKEQFRITRDHDTNHWDSSHILPRALDLGSFQEGYLKVQETKHLSIM